MNKARTLLVPIAVAGALTLCSAQSTNSSKQTTAPARSTVMPKNKRYAIAYVNSTPKWKVGSTWEQSSSILNLISTGLVQRLSSLGFTREQPLEVQCCTVQFALLNVASDLDAAQAKHTFVVARISLVDIDAQQVYTKEFRGQSKAQSSNSHRGVGEAVGNLLDGFVGDEKMLKALRGT